MHQPIEDKFQIQVWCDDTRDWIKVPTTQKTFKQAENVARYAGESNTFHHQRIRIINLSNYDIMFDKVVSCRSPYGGEPYKIFNVPNSDEEVRAVFEWHNVN